MSSLNLLPASHLSGQIFAFGPNPLSSPPPLPPDGVYTPCYCEENIYLLAQTFLVEASTHASRGLAWPWEAYVVFISNRGKTVALWSQKLRAPDVVVWDYHVILVLRRAASVPGILNRDILCGEPGNWKLETRAKSTPILPHLHPLATQLDVENGGPEPWASDTDVDHAENPNAAWVYDFDTTLAVPCSWREYLIGTFPYALDDALKERIDDRFHSLFRVIPANVYVDSFASDRSHMVSRHSLFESVATLPPRSPSLLANFYSSGFDGRGMTGPRAVPGHFISRDMTYVQHQIVHAPGPEARVPNSSVAGAIPHLATASPPNGVPNTKLDGGQGDSAQDTEAMSSSEIQYSSPPPPYPPLRGAKARELGVVHNLMESFVAMEPDPTGSSRAAEEDEDLPEKDLRTSPEMASPDDAGNAAATRTGGGDRGARAGVQYGQVMDVGAFVRWLSAADDTSAPRWGSS